MSHVEWIFAKGANAPPALVARIRLVLEAHKAWDELPVAEALMKAGDELLRAVLAGKALGREVALDLLAADACVTWAFEAASDAPQNLPAQAERAMQQIAELAT